MVSSSNLSALGRAIGYVIYMDHGRFHLFLCHIGSKVNT